MRATSLFISGCLLLLFGFGQTSSTTNTIDNSIDSSGVSLAILGTIQDAGSPHIACKKTCCKELFKKPDESRKVVSLGLVDKQNNFTTLFEATPDITSQVKLLKNHAGDSAKEIPDAVFLTHAHIGHYSGLMYFGKEAVNAKNIPVYAMPRMKTFLEQNGPWSQLVNTQNILVIPIANNVPIKLTSNIEVTPFLVPHRDEYSETVGFIIKGPSKKVLFIPDIDKWEKWGYNIIDEIAKVDYAFIDATFYDRNEINNRDISEIPHPFIIESMALFSGLSKTEKSKIYFIHLNHTNPAINPQSKQAKIIIDSGFNIARFNDSFYL